MRALATGGAGFLLAVLWFDLMFDVQARRHPASDVPAAVRQSIAAYYARVTTAARPMNRLVALAMLATIGALVGEIARAELAAWREAASLVLVLGAVGLAAGRTVANAVRLGSERDPAAEQSRLAHTILRDHVICVAAISAALVLQLLPA